MLVSSPPFHGGEPGAAPGSPTKHFGLSCSKEANGTCNAVGGVRFPYGPL